MNVRNTLRRLPWSTGLANVQLASGAAMLAGLEQSAVPALRWYGMGSSLLIGVGQSRDEIDAVACAQAGVPVHRRMSGGGAVFADEGLLLLDLALPRDHRLMRSDVTEAYHWLGEVWAAALRDLGLPARPISTAEGCS